MGTDAVYWKLLSLADEWILSYIYMSNKDTIRNTVQDALR